MNVMNDIYKLLKNYYARKDMKNDRKSTSSLYKILMDNTPCVYTIMLYTCYQNRQATTVSHNIYSDRLFMLFVVKVKLNKCGTAK